MDSDSARGVDRRRLLGLAADASFGAYRLPVQIVNGQWVFEREIQAVLGPLSGNRS